MMILDPKKAYYLSDEGDVSVIEPANGTDFQLDEVQPLVDGYIEVISLNDKQIMILNDEGKFTKPRNQLATDIAWHNGAIHSRDYICGNAIICPQEMLL